MHFYEVSLSFVTASLLDTNVLDLFWISFESFNLIVIFLCDHLTDDERLEAKRMTTIVYRSFIHWLSSFSSPDKEHVFIAWQLKFFARSLSTWQTMLSLWTSFDFFSVLLLHFVVRLTAPKRISRNVRIRNTSNVESCRTRINQLCRISIESVFFEVKRKKKKETDMCVHVVCVYVSSCDRNCNEEFEENDVLSD